jgi:hypothetical protein
MTKPLFSICHTTARPEKWMDAYVAWWSRAVNPKAIEYILAVDERWGFDRQHPPIVNDATKVHWCTGRRDSTTGWNEAAAQSTGRVLITAQDDQTPPERWDEELGKVIAAKLFLDEEFVVEVSSGPLADKNRLMVISILSRVRYEKLGYVFYPEYRAMYADDEFGEHARKDGIVIDARHLMFYHQHPAQDTYKPWDEVYRAENAAPNFVHGKALLERRRALGFPRP